MSDKLDSFGSCPLPITEHDTVQLSHGSGGQMTNELIEKLFVWAFDNDQLRQQDDNAVIEIGTSKLTFSTDSYVVDPIFFPGGNIGELAVNGTINDVCMNGARPLYLSSAFIIEEGMSLRDLKTIVISMQKAAAAAGVKIVTGDTKVVNKGKGDKLFINTAGIGLIEHQYTIACNEAKPGDIVIVSGSVADHGVAILSKREGLAFETQIESDTAALNTMVARIVEAGGSSVSAMRDPTRGGVAATLNEIASMSKVGIRLRQDKVPVKPAVAGACEMLGLDPLYVANEGKLIAIVGRDKAEAVLQAMKEDANGANAAIIGDVVAENPGVVSMRTLLGAWRIVDMPVGALLPRIC